MSILYYYIDEQTRELRPEVARKVVAQKDHNVDVIRIGVPETIDSVDFETSAVRCMYQRPKETKVRSKTAAYYDTSGGYLWYDWTLQEGDTVKVGKINFSVCLQHIEDNLLTIDWNSTIGEIHVKTSYHSDDSDEGDESITPTVAQRVAVLESMIQRVASGAPIVVGSVSAMTDTAQIYVLTTDGYWYYHDGSAWTAGGTYGAVGTDTTLAQPGVPADGKAVGDALAEAMTGESLEDGESMKYVLSSKYDDFKLVDGYGYFDAVQLLNYGYGGPAPHQRGSNNVIFRIGYGNRSWLSPNYLTDGLFSPDFPIEPIPWAGPAATADPSFMGSLPEGFYITIPDNPVRRGNRFVTVPKSVYGDSASFGEFVASYLDGSIGVKLNTEHMTVLDLDAKFLDITTGTISTVTIEGTQFYTGQLNTGYVSDFLGMTDNSANRYRLWNTFGLFYEYPYAKECMSFAAGFNQQRIFYRVKADAVDGEKNVVNVVNYLINKRHVKIYYMQEVTE